jgi:hypothetical protein
MTMNHEKNINKASVVANAGNTNKEGLVDSEGYHISDMPYMNYSSGDETVLITKPSIQNAKSRKSVRVAQYLPPEDILSTYLSDTFDNCLAEQATLLSHETMESELQQILINVAKIDINLGMLKVITKQSYNNPDCQQSLLMLSKRISALSIAAAAAAAAAAPNNIDANREPTSFTCLEEQKNDTLLNVSQFSPILPIGGANKSFDSKPLSSFSVSGHREASFTDSKNPTDMIFSSAAANKKKLPFKQKF